MIQCCWVPIFALQGMASPTPGGGVVVVLVRGSASRSTGIGTGSVQGRKHGERGGRQATGNYRKKLPYYVDSNHACVVFAHLIYIYKYKYI